jgi:hypothetical protein
MKTATIAASPKGAPPSRGTAPPAVTDAPTASLLKAAPSGADAFLQLLARAVHNFRIYPAESTFRVDAIAACHEAQARLSGGDRLTCRVTPSELFVEGIAIGAGTIIEHELSRRLHRARVAELTVHCTATLRDFSRFCTDLIACDLHQGGESTLAERLTEHGVDAIVPKLAPRPEVLQADASQGPTHDAVQHQRPPQDPSSVAAGSTGYLYPKDKGWVRLDPGAPTDAVSLTDLAVLVDDPCDLSSMLLRLCNDGGTEEVSREAALRLKFDDVATIYASMEPQVSRPMFAKLAQSVLALGPEGRKALLKATVLPGLIDGRSGGQILNDFPDVDLAEAVGLLLELETAEPGLLNAALTRLDLPPERQQAVAPLLQRRLKARDTAKTPTSAETGDALSQFAEKWIKVDTKTGKSFAEFAAFDLSFDAEARAGTSGISKAVETADALEAELACLLSLIRLDPHPQVVEGLLQRLVAVFATLERGERWDAFVLAVAQARSLGAALQTSRPDIADAVSRTLSTCFTRAHALRVVQLYESGGASKATAGRLVAAFGPTIVPIFVVLVEDGLDQQKMTALSQLVGEHARLLAPGLVSGLGRCSPQTACMLLELLSFAGPGFERAISNRLKDQDDRVVQAATRALVQVGTAQAAAAVAAQIRTADGPSCTAAEAALWRFPMELVKSQVFELLRDREFVAGRPDVTFRFLDRAMAADLRVPRETLLVMSGLMYRFWHPALVRVGFKARRMVGL